VPGATDAADDVLEDTGSLFPGRPFAGAQQREHRLAGGCLEDVDGLEAIVVVMGVEQRQLLAAVDGIIGIIDIKHDALRHGLEAGAKQIDHRQPHAPQFAPRRRILEARQGRLAHQIIARLGQASAGQLEGRIKTQNVEVVAVLVAAGNGEHPRPDHVDVSVGRARGVAPVAHAGGQQVGNPEPSLDPGKQQHAAVRRQPSAVEPGLQFLACYG